MNIKKNIALSNRQKRAVELVTKIAETSKCFQKHGAALVNGGQRLINISNNKYDYCSFGERFNPKIRKDWVATRHAEIAVCLNVPQSQTDGAIIYVVRINGEGTLRNSKPCEMCQAVMKFLNIKKVIYSNESGGFDCMKI